MSRIVVVGGINMDLHLFHVTRSPGHTPLLADHYIAQPGGKGANVARAAARLGADVSLIGRVGNDEFGRDCVEAIGADGVDTSDVVVTADHATGFVAIELAEGHHRSLIFAAGANDRVCWDDIEPGLDRLGAADIIIAQAEIPPAALDRLAGFAARSRTPLFLDPTPPNRVSRHLLASTDVITPDLVEAAQLTGRSNTSLLWPEAAARELLDTGATRVIVKTNETGALLADARRCRPDPDPHGRPGRRDRSRRCVPRSPRSPQERRGRLGNGHAIRQRRERTVVHRPRTHASGAHEG